MHALELIEELIGLTNNHIDRVQVLKKTPTAVLRQKQSLESWCVLECIEHLNRYGDFYIPEISKRLQASKHTKSLVFRPGLLGDYFANTMLPGENLKKIKTFPSMNPLNSPLEDTVLDRFIEQQYQLLLLLEKSRNTDLTKVKTSISLSKWITLRLGDTLRIVVYHNLRHIVQSENTLKYFNSKN